LGEEFTPTPADRDTITIFNEKIYQHKAMRINYTTYDMRRSQDSINPRTRADVMVLSSEDTLGEKQIHPFWYARVIGIFHANVRHSGPHSKSDDFNRTEFLWVRWFGRDLSYNAGWEAKRLHRVGFIDSDDSEAFGFLDPNDVIRATHLIPAFAHGRSKELLPPSIARNPKEKHADWVYFYVNM
jgi:hypothetical protein